MKWELKLAYNKIINVTHEDWFELSYWVKVKGNLNFRFGVVAYGKTGSALDRDISDVKTLNDTNGEWVHVTGHGWVKKQEGVVPHSPLHGKKLCEAYVDDVEFRSLGKKPLFVNLPNGDKTLWKDG